jgi:N-acetylglucosaminyldiphosphoundecaprenol N-acetyl-beta-D-mannosaminyltransferase
MDRSVSTLFDISIDNLNLKETVSRIFSLMDDYKKDLRPRYVATVNLDFLANTFDSTGVKNPELFQQLKDSDLVTADGMPLVWLSKVLGQGVKERVTGADLVPKLAKSAAKTGKSIYFLGGEKEKTFDAVEQLKWRYPNLRVAGIACPMVNLTETPSVDESRQFSHIIEAINEAKPDILLLGLGNPKQEVWFRRNQNLLYVPVCIGVGGALNFISGAVERAPKWIQKIGCEWLFRIYQEPRRLWKRYVKDLYLFLILILKSIQKRNVSHLNPNVDEKNLSSPLNCQVN